MIDKTVYMHSKLSRLQFFDRAASSIGVEDSHLASARAAIWEWQEELNPAKKPAPE